jgi:hypothetical protein
MSSTFDISRYVNPGNPLPNIDITAAYRQWQAQHLDEARLAENQRQFNETEATHKSEFSQEQDYKNRTQNDINARFGLELGEKTNARGYEQESNRYKQQQTLLAKARQSAAEGRWNEVESMLGSLKELGADVGRSMDQEGKPIYHLQGGQAPSATGETFGSAMNQINQNRGGGYQFNPSQPQISQQPQRSPFDTNLGTVSKSLRPETSPNVSQDSQEKQPGISPANQQTSQTPATTDSSGNVSQSQAFDPYEINSAQLQRMNSIRMQPLLAGIEGAFPNRFQPQINSLLGGVAAMGGSPENTLDALQKPMDTAARLMGAQLNAEGQMAKADMSQSGREDSQSRLLANDGRTAARRVLKEYGISDAVDNSMNMGKIQQMVTSPDPVAQAQGIKEMIKMVEGSRITDRDFDIAKTGIASDWTQLQQRLSLIVRDGLTPDQKSNFSHMINMYQASNKSRIGAGAKKALKYISQFRTDAERYGAYNEMVGIIPEEYLPHETNTRDPNASFGGTKSVGSGDSKKISVTAPTAGQAVQGVKSLDDEADEFLTP